MITLKEYLKELNKLVETYPNILNFPIVYSIDDEGNQYNKVINSPYLMQIEDISLDSNLEIVGFLGEDNIDFLDCNAVIIN